MKKVMLVSLVAATLLFVGCGEKKEHKSTEQAAAVQKASSEAVKSSASAKQSITEPLPGTPVQKPQSSAAAVSSSVQSVAQEAKESAAEAKEKVAAVKEKVVAKVKEAAKSVEQKAQEVAKAAVGAAGVAAAASGDAAKGKELFGKCASCHGAKGDRKALGKSAVIAGMAKDEVVKKLKGYKAGTLNQYGMGALMKGQVAGLSDADIEALAAYISSLK